MSNIRKLAAAAGNRILLTVSIILILQAAALSLLSLPEQSLPIPGLNKLPVEFGDWYLTRELSLEPDVTAYLKPDDYILRDYVNKSESSQVNLFVAFFRSIQNVYGPHSPSICLPGSGWLIRESAVKSFEVPGHFASFPLNMYVLEKAGARILVLYWYQNNRDVWASETHVKLTFLPDLIRYRRSDISLIRLVMPMSGANKDAALANCLRFRSLLFPSLSERLSLGDDRLD